MKKGLNVTLMTVAIAIMAFQAMAMAPVIGPIGDPIVGSVAGASSATPFVFSDAFDLTAKATDDTTTPVNIRWSYWYSGATEVYRINNVNRVTVSDAAIENPIAAQKINGATTDPADVDHSAATITIRNVKYAPLSGSAQTPGSGIIDAMPVTLFASDGTTYSSKTIMIYTDNGGLSRMSGLPEPRWTPVQHQTTFPTQAGMGWSWAPPAGSVTSSTNAGAAVCIETAALGDNYATWNASWGVISVAKNTVYRIRAKIQGTQTSAESTQFFDFILGNFNSATQTGFNMFGADFMFFDNEGGANAPLLKANGGTTYEMYWCPPSVGNAAFNSSNIWDASGAEYRKMLLVFRVMDLQSFGALTAQNDSGRLCLNDFSVDAIPTEKMSLNQIWSSPATMTAANFHAASVIGTTTYQSDKVLLGPGSLNGTQSSTLEFGGAFPGDGDLGDYSPAQLGRLADEYPIAWEAKTLYRIAFKYSAVDAASAAAPFDVIWVGMDCPSNEFIVTSYVTSQGGVGVNPAMPKVGAPQEYVAFLYSHELSKSSIPEFLKFRPRSEWANSPSMVESPGTGSTYFHGATVSKVTFTN